MRKKGAFSAEAFRSLESEVRSKGGPATAMGEQRAREGRGLDPLVDPRSHDGWREAKNLLVPQKGGTFLLEAGVAMPVKTELDLTGSMGGNVELAFGSLPRVQNLLALATEAVLKGRYQAQICTGAVQDVGDQFPYQVSEFEPDIEVAQQMRLLVPEKAGGDAPEDYQLGLFSTGLRTRTSIVEYGLKGYYFIVGDERGRSHLSKRDVKRIFGGDPLQSDIDVESLGKKVLESWHAFFLQVGNNSTTTRYWSEVLGQERVVILPRTGDIAEVQAAIVGLTEGVVDLQNVMDFLMKTSQAPKEGPDFLMGKIHVSKEVARRIVRAVNHIPLRAQAELSNFGKLPAIGSVFASRDDLWPMKVGAKSESLFKSEGLLDKPKPAEDVDWEQL